MKKLLPSIFLILVLLFSASQALAICEGPIVPCGRSGTPPCQFCHIFVIITNIINFLFTCLAPIAAALMFILGGLFMMVSNLSGDESSLFSQGKNILTATVVGMVIIFVSWVFLNSFLTFMEVKEWTGLGTWWQWTNKCPLR